MRPEVDSPGIVQSEPAQFDANIPIRGSVGSGLLQDGRVRGGDGVDEGELVEAGPVQIEEVLDDPE